MAADSRLCRLLRPFGLFFGRRQFREPGIVGRADDVPWAVRFVEMTQLGPVLGPPRHPSQLYEAVLEGLVLAPSSRWMFWKTQARYQPGKLVGAFLFSTACSASAWSSSASPTAS